MKKLRTGSILLVVALASIMATGCAYHHYMAIEEAKLSNNKQKQAMLARQRQDLLFQKQELENQIAKAEQDIQQLEYEYDAQRKIVAKLKKENSRMRNDIEKQNSEENKLAQIEELIKEKEKEVELKRAELGILVEQNL